MPKKKVYYDLPAFETLVSPDYFGQEGGTAYFYCGTIVRYIAERYGIETLNEIIRNPTQERMEQVLNRSVLNLYEEWKADLEDGSAKRIVPLSNEEEPPGNLSPTVLLRFP